jgi:ABC transporter substrate binding protein
VASPVEVIITIGYPSALAAKQGTTLPVVAINAGDPVSTGLVESLARPGGHLTGISDVSADLTPKRLELLTQLVPTLRRVAMLWNATDLGMTCPRRPPPSEPRPYSSPRLLRSRQAAYFYFLLQKFLL